LAPNTKKPRIDHGPAAAEARQIARVSARAKWVGESKAVYVELKPSRHHYEYPTLVMTHVELPRDISITYNHIRNKPCFYCPTRPGPSWHDIGAPGGPCFVGHDSADVQPRRRLYNSDGSLRNDQNLDGFRFLPQAMYEVADGLYRDWSDLLRARNSAPYVQHIDVDDGTITLALPINGGYLRQGEWVAFEAVMAENDDIGPIVWNRLTPGRINNQPHSGDPQEYAVLEVEIASGADVIPQPGRGMDSLLLFTVPTYPVDGDDSPPKDWAYSEGCISVINQTRLHEATRARWEARPEEYNIASVTDRGETMTFVDNTGRTWTTDEARSSAHTLHLNKTFIGAPSGLFHHGESFVSLSTALPTDMEHPEENRPMVQIELDAHDMPKDLSGMTEQEWAHHASIDFPGSPLGVVLDMQMTAPQGCAGAMDPAFIAECEREKDGNGGNFGLRLNIVGASGLKAAEHNGSLTATAFEGLLAHAENTLAVSHTGIFPDAATRSRDPVSNIVQPSAEPEPRWVKGTGGNARNHTDSPQILHTQTQLQQGYAIRKWFMQARKGKCNRYKILANDLWRYLSAMEDLGLGYVDLIGTDRDGHLGLIRATARLEQDYNTSVFPATATGTVKGDTRLERPAERRDILNWEGDDSRHATPGWRPDGVVKGRSTAGSAGEHHPLDFISGVVHKTKGIRRPSAPGTTTAQAHTVFRVTPDDGDYEHTELVTRCHASTRADSADTCSLPLSAKGPVPVAVDNAVTRHQGMAVMTCSPDCCPSVAIFAEKKAGTYVTDDPCHDSRKPASGGGVPARDIYAGAPGLELFNNKTGSAPGKKGREDLASHLLSPDGHATNRVRPGEHVDDQPRLQGHPMRASMLDSVAQGKEPWPERLYPLVPTACKRQDWHYAFSTTGQRMFDSKPGEDGVSEDTNHRQTDLAMAHPSTYVSTHANGNCRGVDFKGEDYHAMKSNAIISIGWLIRHRIFVERLYAAVKDQYVMDPVSGQGRYVGPTYTEQHAQDHESLVRRQVLPPHPSMLNQSGLPRRLPSAADYRETAHKGGHAC